MHLIVTRPKTDGDKLKTRLQANGHTASVVPLLTIEADDKATIPGKPWQAIAITSANALTAFAGIGISDETKPVPVFAVGPASADLARELGFADVQQAAGDLDALQQLMKKSLKPDNGPILYLTGKARSGDLAADLQSDGFTVERIELYDAVAAAEIPTHAQQTIRSGKADAVVLYSARTAAIWAQLVKQGGLQAQAAQLTHFCLSEAVAEKIHASLGRNVSVVISGNPDDDAMLETIDETAANHSIHNATPGKGDTMANRKTPSRKAKKPARPTVIDAKATEIEPAETVKTTSSQAHKTSAATSDTGSAKTSEKPSDKARATGPATGAGAVKGKPSSQGAAKDKPQDTRKTGSPSPEKTSSGKGKLITGALIVTLLAGVAGGGYLYREHGARLFGSTAPAIDVGAIEGQAKQAIGTAQSASETASTALAQAQSLSKKVSGLEQQLKDTGNTPSAPDASTLASISDASELARSAKSDTEALAAKTGAIETGMGEVRKSLDSLKTALQAAASTGGGAGQAEINLKFDELAERIKKLETTQAQPVDDKITGEVAALRDQLAAASARMEKLESQLKVAIASPGPDTTTTAQPPAAAIDTTRIAAQLAALSDTVNQGKPYQAALSALEEAAGLTVSLPALVANAATGIRTNAQLQQDLADVKAKLDAAAAASESSAGGSSSGLWGTISSKLSSVIKVRKVAGSGDWAGHTAAAIAALETGGLGAAIAALDAGGAAAPDAVSAWIVEARKRQSADQELQKLPQIILGHLPAPAQ